MLPKDLSPTLSRFLTVCGVFASLFVIGGFIALWGSPRPAVWAALSASIPVVILAIAYWRVMAFDMDLKWSLAALAVAGLNLLGAQRVAVRNETAGMDGALAAFAVGVIASISLAAAMALEEAWLTVALAAQLPAMAWVCDRLRVAGLRQTAFVVALVVIGRLVANPSVLDYALGATPGVTWILYGYGIPMAAFFVAARRFRRSADDGLVVLLEAGALAFGTLLVSFEIRHLISGDLGHPEYTFQEQCLQSIAWLVIAFGQFRGCRHDRRIVRVLGWQILATLAAAQVVVFQVFLSNPLFSGAEVGDWPLINFLTLGYGAPAVLAILFLREARKQGMPVLVNMAGVAALSLLFLDLTLEVRRAFHGSDLSLGSLGNAEWYCYSAAWIVYAGTLLALGILRGIIALRHAAVIVMVLSVVKVFVFDMAELEGLYRVVSFIGLGVSLVFIGFLYQRFVFSRGLPAE